MATKWRGIFKIQEETGELNQALGKLGAFPSGTYHDGSDLIAPVQDELSDVLATILYFIEVNNLQVDELRIRKKLDLFRNWDLTGVENG